MKRTIAAVVLVVVAIAAATFVNLGRDDGGSTAGPDVDPVTGEDLVATAHVSRLQQFDECPDLLSRLQRDAAARVGPWGLAGQGFGIGGGGVAVMDGAEDFASSDAAAGAPAAREAIPVEGEDFSGTNVQEAGVDEPDSVKTDGVRLWIVSGETTGRFRLHELRVGDDTADPIAEYELPASAWSHQLLMDGDRLLVISQGGTPFGPRPLTEDFAAARGMGADMIAPFHNVTTLTLYDISTEGGARAVSTRVIEGSHISSRLVDGVARIVVRNDAPQFPFEGPILFDEPMPMPMPVEPGGAPAVEPGFGFAPEPARSEQEAIARNRELIFRTTLEDWLPRTRLETPERGFVVLDEQPLIDCRNVFVPETFAGFGFVSVLSVDLGADLEATGATAVQTDGQLVYASPDNLYVATPRWWAPEFFPNGQPPADFGLTTAIHQFDITDPASATYAASGLVAGTLLNQFSMSEYDGHLRVATTFGEEWWGGRDSESGVTVFRRDGTDLAKVGEVGGLGRGERIFAVRFMGELGYVVTFRQTDPLYTLDLRDPASPIVTGELKILGYSAYLHPVGEGRLLGVGQDATLEGRTLGTQVSLFDVSDPADPRRLQSARFNDSYSEVEVDHKAFLFWPRTGRTVVPVQSWGERPFNGALTFNVDEVAGITEGRFIDHGNRAGNIDPWTSRIRRSVVIGDDLLTISDVGVLVSDLDTLEERAWTWLR